MSARPTYTPQSYEEKIITFFDAFQHLIYEIITGLWEYNECQGLFLLYWSLTCSPCRYSCRIVFLNQRIKGHGNKDKCQGNAYSNHNGNVMFLNHRQPSLWFFLFSEEKRVIYCLKITNQTRHETKSSQHASAIFQEKKWPKNGKKCHTFSC